MIAEETEAGIEVLAWLFIIGGFTLVGLVVYLLVIRGYRTTRTVFTMVHRDLHAPFCTGPTTGYCSDWRCPYHQDQRQE